MHLLRIYINNILYGFDLYRLYYMDYITLWVLRPFEDFLNSFPKRWFGDWVSTIRMLIRVFFLESVAPLFVDIPYLIETSFF